MLPRPPVTMIAPRPQIYPIRHPGKVTTQSAFTLAFAASFCFVAVVGLAIWLIFNLNRGPAVSLPSANPATFAGTASSGRAEDLYERVAISMSLYDLGQAAGGMGRIIHTNDPHALLLSYDFPEQSVRVSLYRSDIAGDDYRVDAVALYHGTTLLQRHADN